MAEKQKWWEPYRVDRFEFEGKKARVVHPPEGTSVGRLAIKTEYFSAFPEAVQVPLLEQGFHLCYVENENRWGTDDVLDRQARFLQYVTESYGLAKKAVPIGMSCGGLIAIKLAAKYPEQIACLYLDNPVVNYMSCPCGFGIGEPLDGGKDIPEALEALGYETVSELLSCRDMPLDKLPELVKHQIPAVMVAGLQDNVAPYCENGALVEKAYRETGLELAFFQKPQDGHHPHGLKNPKPVVEFILSHS